MADPIDVVVVGTALDTFGFVGLQYTIAGLGLNTFGFLWPCDAIWTCSDMPITTIWTSVTLPVMNTEICSE